MRVYNDIFLDRLKISLQTAEALRVCAQRVFLLDEKWLYSVTEISEFPVEGPESKERFAQLQTSVFSKWLNYARDLPQQV